MAALGIVTGFLPLIVIIGLGWFVAQAIRGDGDRVAIDPAALVRRVGLYAFLFIALMFAVQGLVDILQAMVGESDRTDAALAQAIAFSVVGLPVTAALLRTADRRLTSDPGERASVVWMVHLDVVLITSLVASLVETQHWLGALLGDGGFLAAPFVSSLVWIALGVGYWVVLLRRHGVIGDLHLAAGSLIGLGWLAAGVGGLVWLGLDELHRALTDTNLGPRDEPRLGTWAAAAALGAITWGWFWLRHYRTAERTPVWFVTTVPVGSLVGLVAAVAAGSRLLYLTATWFVGDREPNIASLHFEEAPVAIALGIVGVASWRYHRAVLGRSAERNDAIRVADYLSTAAALLAGVIGAVVVISSLLDPDDRSTNDLLAGATAAAVGLPLWLHFWRNVQRHVANERNAELRSPVRRIHVFAVLGGAGLATLISTVTVLRLGIEDALGGTLGRSTLEETRFSLAVLVTVAGVAWYHFGVLRAERAEYTLPPAPHAPEPRHRRVVVVLGAGDSVPESVRAMHDIELTVLRTHPDTGPDDDLLVIVDDDHLTVSALDS